MMRDIVFFDTEIGVDDKRIHDIGAIRARMSFHSANIPDFLTFIAKTDFLCGHNIVRHDLQYLPDILSFTISSRYLFLRT